MAVPEVAPNIGVSPQTTNDPLEQLIKETWKEFSDWSDKEPGYCHELGARNGEYFSWSLIGQYGPFPVYYTLIHYQMTEH